MLMIPLVDLKIQYLEHKFEFDQAVTKVIQNSQFINGPECQEFEREFAHFCGGGYATLCGNGTDALYLCIREILGLGDGTGEIITVPNTFIATTEAITMAGYRPVFIDVDPDTYTMDPELIESAISPKTRAIIPVHLYGQMAPMDKIADIGKRYQLKIIEDAAQAHGAKWMGKGPGMWGDAACFSFYPGKNLGCWGDGGAIFTQNKDLAESVRMRANHGRTEKYIHRFEGMNSRLDEIQAAILRIKLRYLNTWNLQRRENADRYTRLLSSIEGIKTPVTHPDAEHVFYVYVIETVCRDQLNANLKKSGIDAGVHYPVPLHKQPALKYLDLPSDLYPNANTAADRILSLPMFPELKEQQIQSIVAVIKETLRQDHT
jgi:dTDP-4-amino-4,6-dideoxygalactose transaminase